MTPIAPPVHRLCAVAPSTAEPAALGGAAGLAVEIRRGGPRPVVVVAGELDLSGRDLLEALLGHVRAGSRQSVAVDLAQVPFADTHGLEPVLEPDVVVVAASPPVTRLLRHLEILTGRPLTPRRARARDRAAAVAVTSPEPGNAPRWALPAPHRCPPTDAGTCPAAPSTTHLGGIACSHCSGCSSSA